MHRSTRPRLSVTAAALFCAATATAQTEWRQRELMPRFSGPTVFDLQRDRLVVLTPPVGLSPTPETWEWDRTAWHRRLPANSPPWRGGGHALAYDWIRGRVLLFSGAQSVFGGTRETWQWDGSDWSNAGPAVQPPARSRHAMVYDLLRDRIVLFGGARLDPSGGWFGDTWEWDGAAWTQRATTGPAARHGHGIAYDIARGRTVIFGGDGLFGTFDDTWTWDGATWTRMQASGPSARTDPNMGYDMSRARVVLFGGSASWNQQFADTWEWDGAAWTQLAPASSPPPRGHAGLVGDPLAGGMLLAGGLDANRVLGDLWRFDGATWSLTAPAATPPARHSHAAAFDPANRRLLVFGGVGSEMLGDFWQWDGTGWSELPVVAGPSPRNRAAMVHDSVRNRMVLFGGELPGMTDETWEWDGVAWTLAAPATRPSARMMHAMAFDAARARVVLFGGVDSTYNGETWEWDGATWQQQQVPGPSPRHTHAMAYDAARGVTVLYGGLGNGFPFGTVYADTWEWDGVAWTQRQPPTNPGPRNEFGLAFDAARGRVVLFGNQTANDTWEWTGTDWLQRPVATPPPSRIRAPLAYDSTHGRVLLFGGQSMGPNYSDLWEYGPVQAAGSTSFGAGCLGSRGLATLSAAPPWLGDLLQLEVQNVPPATLVATWLGTSRALWGSTVLPLPLAALGMPGCSVLASIDGSVLRLASAAGEAAWAIAVPNAAVLLGLEVFAQAAFIDPPVNAAGAAATAGLQLRIGGR